MELNILNKLIGQNHKHLLILEISCVLLCLMIIVIGGSLLPQAETNDTGMIVVKIPGGYTTQQIAMLLNENHVINNQGLFSFWVRLSGYSSSLQAGTYAFSLNENILQIINKIGTGAVFDYESIRITIPEGYTLAQMAKLFAEKQLVDEVSFLDAAKTLAVPYDWVSDIPEDVLYKYEGYLFPDTYEFASYHTGKDIVKRMIDRFNDVVIPVYNNSDIKDRYSLHEIITLASLIEKEAMRDDERATISSVFYNRLDKNYLLQSCATVQYVLPVHREILSTEETKTDSPYNTYIHAGLPPGPIASVGLASIQAAVAPAETDYFFFNAINHGKHHFSITYAEHLRSIRENK